MIGQTGKLRPLLLLALSALPVASLLAAPVSVRFKEGALHGYLALRNEQAKLIAVGDLIQVTHGDRLASHLVFHFKDGSLDDESAVFTQQNEFRLITDHHVQRGPSFPQPLDLAINTVTGNVTSRSAAHGKITVQTEHLELPPDLVNGMILTVLKNLQLDAKQTVLSYLAATPKPRIVRVVIQPEGKEPFVIASTRRQATHLVVKVELGGITGMIAPLIGKQPSDTNVWIADDTVPAFLKSQGPLTVDGPIWSVEMATPRWP